MEKEPQPESIATIPMKPDYPPSEVYSSEPPPLNYFQAYHRPQSASVQVAKIIAVTIVVVSVVLGGFLLASAYVTANASCRQLEQELLLLTETADRLQPPLQPEALVQEQPQEKETVETAQVEDSPKQHVKEFQDNSVAQDSSDESDSSESEEEDRVTPIHIKLPLQLDLDDLAGAIIDKNQRSKMNCIVEKKRAEEVVDHQPKTVRLPFGVNLTTDPRYEHVTGERMVILCESGSLQSHSKPQPQPEEQEETIMIQPMVIPIGPINPFQTHMQQQMRPMQQQQQQQMHNMPYPMESLRPPMPDPVMPQNGPQQGAAPPNAFIQHLAQQIINQRIRMEMQRAHEEAAQRAQDEASQREEVQVSNEVPQAEIDHRRIPGAEVMMAQRIPIPEEVLRQINRLPNHEVIVSVSEESDEAPQELRIIQHPRQSAQEMNGRQTYARGLPVHIPVPMMQQQVQQEPQEQQHVPIASSEEMRPHYVQPRSVRSVDAVLQKSQKRIKRCACDCAC